MTNQNLNTNYDATPVKDTGGKIYQQAQYMPPKRELSNPDCENSNGNNVFGSHVPPFPNVPPFNNDGNELNQHYVPTGNGKKNRQICMTF